jgi:hypothetical protein
LRNPNHTRIIPRLKLWAGINQPKSSSCSP